MIRGRKEIYQQIVKEKHPIEAKKLIDPLVPDQALRRANVYAVQNTERVFQEQYELIGEKGEPDLRYSYTLKIERISKDSHSNHIEVMIRLDSIHHATLEGKAFVIYDKGNTGKGTYYIGIELIKSCEKVSVEVSDLILALNAMTDETKPTLLSTNKIPLFKIYCLAKT